MIVRMGLLTRKPGLATEQFRQHWREVHGPLAAKLPGLRRYHQNYILGSPQRDPKGAQSDWRLDGISELWFDDPATMRAAIAPDAYRAVAADEPNCMVQSKAIVAEQNVVLPVEPGNVSQFVKCMSILIRAPGLNTAAGRQTGFETDASMGVARLPGLVGYTLNVVVARMAAGAPAPYETIPVDGLAEIWFRDAETLQAAFASQFALDAQTCASGLTGTASTWQVEANVVV
jgi:uncharacterized protein (TIGR02118 family)